MKRCIDCDYKFTCGKTNPKVVCERYSNTSKNVRKLNKVEEGYFEFEKIYEEEKTNEIR